ncbi:hypothetical protein [Luteibacter sp. 3190]|uniref:hypothetical protein n=1 Tax=Luteibacter sp. 3190 TaxID=2817736 RepID=UPI0028609217|nr:hypothetical protein [Luteibacter sp. 3190]MDR6937325.1 hypothetical protein [Luteibacter sp. 3190]
MTVERNVPTAHELDLAEQYRFLLTANSTKISARRLIELCALRAVMPREVIDSPADAAVGLFGPCQWGRSNRRARQPSTADGFDTPEVTTEDRLSRFLEVATRMATNREVAYMPPASFILKACGLARNITIEHLGDEYRRYRRLHEAQGSISVRVDYNRAFKLALHTISGLKGGSVTEVWVAEHAHSLAREAHVVRAKAQRCLHAAWILESFKTRWRNDDDSRTGHASVQEKIVTAESESREAYQSRVQATLKRLFWLAASSQEELELIANHGVDREVCTSLVAGLVPVGYLAVDPPGVFHGLEATLLLRLCWLYTQASVLLDSDTAASIWVLKNFKAAPLEPSDIEASLAFADELITRIRRTREFIL